MKTLSTALALALALGVTVTGCASDPSMMGDDDGGGGGDGNGDGTGNEPPRPLDPTGMYTMHSTFDLATGMPGTAGTVVNTIIAATDDPDEDPTLWIIEQIIAQLSPGTVRSALDSAKDFIALALNDRLVDLAPDFVDTMLQVGHDFGDMARHFSINETLQLSGSGGSYTAVHSVVGAHYKIDGHEGDIALASYHVSNIVVDNVGVTMDATGQLTVASHTVALPYGKLLKLALDAGVVPLLDSSAHDLKELIAHKVNCDRIGQAIHDELPVAGAATFAAACTAGIAAGANYVYSKIDQIDSTALQFSLTGTARAVDKNNDRRIDSIQTGAWSGTLTYGSTPTQLLPATFVGEHM